MPEPLKVDPIVLNVQDVLGRTEHKWPGWWNNFAENLPTVRSGKDISLIPKRKGPAIIVGAGPSLLSKHLVLLKQVRLNHKATIISTDRMLRPLIQVGLHPDFVATVDGDPSVADFYDIPTGANATMSILNAVTTHPMTVKIAQARTADLFWFISFFDDPQQPKCNVCQRISPTAGFHFMTNRKTILQALGNVGALCWHLGYYLGCNPLILIGMDYSYKPDTKIETTHYYDAYLKIAAKEHLFETLPQDAKFSNPFANFPQADIEDHVKKCLKCRQRVRDTYAIETNPDFKEDYMIDKIWTVYKTLLMPFIGRAKVQTINCSGGALHGRGITGISLEEAVRRYCN